MALSSQPLAGVGVAYAGGEEAEAERQHDDIQHGMLLYDMNRATEPTTFALDGCEVPSGA